MKKVLILVTILVACSIFWGGCSQKPSAPTPTPVPEEVVFGALLPLTGDRASMGESTQVALKIAVREINEYLSSIGSKIGIRLLVEDTKTNPMVAREKLKDLAGKGVRVVIGPYTSAELKAVKAYADKNGILLLSCSSTAPSLTVPEDNLFRFVPDDTHQAEALARWMWQDGIKVIIPMYRGDVWGEDLCQAERSSFAEFGGRVTNGIRYRPTTRDFSRELKSLSVEVGRAIVHYGSDAVGVHLMAFDEVVPIFLQAQNDPRLSKVKWYGSDGTALNPDLINHPPAARFAISTGFVSPAYGKEDETENYAFIRDRIREKIGREPDAYAIVSYDALCVATQAYFAAGRRDDPSALKKALHTSAQIYYGASGWTILNEAGDREFGNYDFWLLRKKQETFYWDRAGDHLFCPGKARWVMKVGDRLIYDLD